MFKKTTIHNAKTEDIIHALGNAVPVAVAQARVANLPEIIGLSGGNAARDGEITGKWIRANVHYKIDDFENQNIQLPSALLRSGLGDCKSFSLLFCAIMNAAGYNCGFRFARYRNTGNFTHVYNIVENQNNLLTFDTCIKNLKELKHFKEIKDMRVNYIAGEPLMIQEKAITRQQMKRQMNKPTLRQLMRDDRYLSLDKIGEVDGIGKRGKKKKEGKGFFKKLGDKVKDTVKKVGGKVKTVALAPARGPFLVLVDVNFRGLARKLNKLRSQNPDRYKSFWLKTGGDIDALNKAVDKGKDKKPFLGEKKRGRGVSGANEVVYMGEPVTLAAVSTAMAAASGIIVSLKKIFQKEGIQSEPGEEELTEGIDENAPIVEGAEPGEPIVPSDPASEESEKYITKGIEKVFSPGGSNAGGTGFKLSPMLLIGGAAAVLGIIMLTKKK